jgi:catalase-peroxidase
LIKPKPTQLAVLACALTMMSMAAAAASTSAGTDTGTGLRTAQFYWPEQLSLAPLRQHGAESSPYDSAFDYRKAFAEVDVAQLKADIKAVLTTSQPWWPADYGNYGPFFIRMAWHGAGTYRVSDGRGGAGSGQQRFEPLNSWPDNVNLDKARRLLWPVKQKYGRSVSWADLMVLTGNVSLESMGFKTYGFSGGRMDDWEPELVNWGPETKMMGDQRHGGGRKLQHGLAAVQMGLIYVNPEGPNGVPDPMAAAKDIRASFGQMAMNDEETVALIAGGHTFGKAHGAHKPEECVGREPAAAGVELQGMGWTSKCGKGNAEDTVSSGLEGAWTSAPAQWTHQYLSNLYGHEWVQTKSPAGAVQWVPKNADQAKTVPDAHIKGKLHAPIMFTTDLALRTDPSYKAITQRWLKNPQEFEVAFAKAWFKLTHRDLGPRTRYLGGDAPKEDLIWQDPIPSVDHPLLDASDAAALKAKILASGLSGPELVRTAWGSAATFRGSDFRGGANGARIRLAPQKDWDVNNPAEVDKVVKKLEGIQAEFNKSAKGGKKVSLADLIVLGGDAAVEAAAKKAGHTVSLPFTPGRMDASAAQTDITSFAVLEPKADGFRNFYGPAARLSPAEEMVERATLLTLTVPEMTALVGGLRALDANSGGSKSGVFTSRPGVLSNDFFVNLLSMETQWVKSKKSEGLYEGVDRKTGKVKWAATPVDLAFGSSAELRAVAEVYGAKDGEAQFVREFAKAWSKVMHLDRFDLKKI